MVQKPGDHQVIGGTYANYLHGCYTSKRWLALGFLSILPKCWWLYPWWFTMVKKVKRHEFNKSKGFHKVKASTSQGINIWVFPKMVVPPFHTPKWSFLVGKPIIVVGYHHFRKPLYPTKGIIIFKSADWNRICCFRFKKIGPLSEKNDEFKAFNGILCTCRINDISIYQCHLEASSFPLKAVLPHTNEWAVHAVDVVFYWQPKVSF